MTLGKAVEAATVVYLLVMRTSTITERAFLLLELFRLSLGAVDKSLPGHVMSAGMAE